MHDSILGHIARRAVRVGVKCAHGMRKGGPVISAGYHAANNDDPLKNILERIKNPKYLIPLISATLIYVLFTTALEYVIRIVAVNLAIVEDQGSNGSIKLPDNKISDLVKEPLLNDYDGVEAQPQTGVSTRLTTASLRSTIRHVRSVMGIHSLFRGLHFGLFYAFVYSAFGTIFGTFIMNFGLPIDVAHLLTAIVTCNLHAAWTHATIAEPSDKPFFQRFLPRKTACKLILPAIRLQLAFSASKVIAMVIPVTVNSFAGHHHDAVGRHVAIGGGAILMVVSILGLILPAHIALIRAEASLLPEDTASIVPFDRTFGGRLTWDFASRKERIIRGLTMRGAYMSFDRDTYKRTIFMYAKLFAIISATTFVYLVNIGVVVHIFLRNNPDVQVFILQVMRQHKQGRKA